MCGGWPTNTAKIREISVLRIPAALDQIDITEGKRCAI
jgi:hypothetical protein